MSIMHKRYQEERLAIIDLGTMAIRLNVYEGYVSVYQEKSFTGIGSTLSEKGHLSPKGKAIVWQKLKEYKKTLSLLEVSYIAILATEAFRSSEDTSDFINKLKHLDGMPLIVLSGEKEAYFLSKGVLAAFPKFSGLVCDCGGGSIEIINMKKGKVGELRSFPYGVMRMSNILLHMQNPRQYVRKMLENDSWISSVKKDQTLYITGGTWRTLAQVFMLYKEYPLMWVNNYSPDLQEFLSYMRKIPSINFDKILLSRIQKQSRLLPTASILFESFLDMLKPSKIIFCAYGLREGYLRELLKKREFKDSPLVSCTRYEARENDRSTISELPKKLYNFSLPENMLLAAYFLAVMKNEAPDKYKGDHAFLRVINLPLVGCTHKELVFLSYAVGLSFGEVHLVGKKAELIKFFLDENDKKQARKLSEVIKP